MSTLLRLVALLVLATPALAQPAPRLVRIPVDIGLWRDVSLSDALLRDTTEQALNHLALALPLHQAGQLEGVAVGVIGTVYEESVYGFQVSGVANVAGASALGVQVAGIANVAGESLHGFQVAGFANVVGEEMRGLQVAGFANVVGEEGGYLQSAGFANVAGEDFLGVQVAGFVSIAGEDFAGIQAAGFASIAGEGAGGVQTAGFTSIAGESFTGVQTAGFVVIAGDDLFGVQAAPINIVGAELRGVQVGLVNVAAESEGLQVGLVNVAGEQRGVPVGLYSRTGGVPVWLDVWADETAALHVGARSGSETVTNYVGLSTRPLADAQLRWGAFAGIGLRHAFSAQTEGGVDLFAHALFADDLGYGGAIYRLRGTVTRSLSSQTELFGGVALSLFLSDEDDGESLAPFSLYDDASGGDFVRLWPGLEAGFRIRLTRD